MNEIYYTVLIIFEWLKQEQQHFFFFIPLLVIMELPINILVFMGVFSWFFKKEKIIEHCPNFSLIVTCYNEGKNISQTIKTLVEQKYQGKIEILVVIDGADINKDTLNTALQYKKIYENHKNREIVIIPKWKRGGVVSSLNAGLNMAKYEFLIRLDGDCSFDNDMVLEISKKLQEPNTVAIGGTLRVRNWDKSLVTRMQSLEYMLSIQQGKTGMSEFGILNNISGAFGSFKKSFVTQIGGWDTHTAEDLDMTIRLKQYQKRYPHLKSSFQPSAIAHTDVPDNILDLAKQRVRWDGDLFFQMFKKHKKGFSPSFLGWKNFLFMIIYEVFQICILPLIIFAYSMYLIFFLPYQAIISLLILLYIFYAALAVVQFFIHIVFISERKIFDLSFILWIPLYPIYLIILKQVGVFAFFNEVIRNGHEESTMAPWWVFKNNRF